jgi:hypothetical protein
MVRVEHFRPVGKRTDARELAQGYYCPLCGEGGLNMLGHHSTVCEPNPELVHLLTIVNHPMWEFDNERRGATNLAEELLP